MGTAGLAEVFVGLFDSWFVVDLKFGTGEKMLLAMRDVGFGVLIAAVQELR